MWVVDWWDPEGKRHQPQFPTKEKAEDEAARILLELRAQPKKHDAPELPPDTTWTGLFERVIANRGDLKPRTLEGYRDIHARHLAPAFGVTPVRMLSRRRIKEFLRGRMTRYSRNTVRLMHATLHVALEEAAEDGLIDGNPAAGLAKKLKLSVKVKARQTAAKKKAMTRDERDAFLAAAERKVPWWAPMWTVQTLTGLRPGEIYALEERDIDFATRVLHVERSLSDDGERTDTPKGGISREVDLSNEAIRILRAHLVRRREEKLRRKWPALLRLLFCTTTGTDPDPARIRHAFEAVCKAAKLMCEKPGADGKPRQLPRFSPHALRHTFAALHLQTGTDVYYVSQQLGHADISLTIHTYRAWLKPDRRPTVDVLDRTAEPAAKDLQAWPDAAGWVPLPASNLQTEVPCWSPARRLGRSRNRHSSAFCRMALAPRPRIDRLHSDGEWV